MTFNNWLDTLIEEKGYDLDDLLEVEGPSGVLNVIPLEVLVDSIKGASASERASIKNVIVKLDFVNANVLDYLRHLAQAIAV